MYVCGITPYDVTHLGHASTFIWADAADKVLSWAGNTVTVARNVTDVDDVLYAEAQRRGQDPTLFGAVQRAAFEATMSTLRVRTPHLQPTAAQAIGHVIQLAATLLRTGHAYLRGGTVYARTARAAPKAGLDRDTALARAAEYHDEPDDPDKDDPLDVAVWRAAGVNEASWPSPWGTGRPGWHAECAAMVLALFGAGVDIHGGGADLTYPHHACEAALAEAATGVAPFARAWLRAGVVALDGEKMAKSRGNLVLVEDLLRTYSPAAIRLLCLNRERTETWSYTADLLDAAAETLDDLYAAAAKPGPVQVCDALADALLTDLDVPAAIAIALGEGGATARALIDILALS
jgi:cysteinyl-tRNA synthetase